MNDDKPTADTLAKEILNSNDDISPLLCEVKKKVRLLRKTGLSDEKIRTTVPGIYRVTEETASNGGLQTPKGEEIRVISMPLKYQREDWT